MEKGIDIGQQYSPLASELQLVAGAFSDQKDREIILQYADEIEQLTAKTSEPRTLP